MFKLSLHFHKSFSNQLPTYVINNKLNKTSAVNTETDAANIVIIELLGGFELLLMISFVEVVTFNFRFIEVVLNLFATLFVGELVEFGVDTCIVVEFGISCGDSVMFTPSSSFMSRIPWRFIVFPAEEGSVPVVFVGVSVFGFVSVADGVLISESIFIFLKSPKSRISD